MKETLLIIILCLCSVCGYSQTAKFTFHNDQNHNLNNVTCEITVGDTVYKSDESGLGYCGKITRIEFVEDPKLESQQKHSIFVGNIPIVKDKKLQQNWGIDLNNEEQPTLQQGDLIKCSRESDDNSKSYTIPVKFSKDAVEEQVVFEPHATNKYAFANSESRTFKFKVIKKDRFSIETINVSYLDTMFTVGITDDECISFKVNPSKATTPFPVNVDFTIKGHPYYEVTPRELCSIEPPIHSRSNDLLQKLKDIVDWNILLPWLCGVLFLAIIVWWRWDECKNLIWRWLKRKELPNEKDEEGIDLEDVDKEGESDANPESQGDSDSVKESLEQKDKEIGRLKKKNEELHIRLNSAQKTIRTYLEKLGKIKSEVADKERERQHLIHRKDIIDNYVQRTDHTRILGEKEKALSKVSDDLRNSERARKFKETELNDANNKIRGLQNEIQEKEKYIATCRASMEKVKGLAIKKNMHYVLQLKETLDDVTMRFREVYQNIDNTSIMNGLIMPMIKGVSGLGAGIMSWKEDFHAMVEKDPEGFWGGDFLTMDECDVKEKLAKTFISSIVKSDSFSKFVRLYHLSNVPFIRMQFERAGMNVVVLSELYHKLYALVTYFEYQIICPRLFEEQYSETRYQWFGSTNLFDIVVLSETDKGTIKQLGSEIIIDVNQIGYKSPWALRNATVVTPDF